jgi:hypothetical protein
MGSDFDLHRPSFSWVRWFANHPSRTLKPIIAPWKFEIKDPIAGEALDRRASGGAEQNEMSPNPGIKRCALG